MSPRANADGGEARRTAVSVLVDVLENGQSLTPVLESRLANLKEPAQRGLVQELSYGVLRWFSALDALAGELVSRPLKRKDRDLHMLVLVGLYQLRHLDLPDYAAINETVKVTDQLRKKWARGLVNGVLRRFQREQETLESQALADDAARLAHPEWLLERFREDWPQDWRAIADANNRRPPFTLRVNRRHGTREAYLAELRAAGMAADASDIAENAITLQQAVGVNALPGFSEGRVSVQDGAAQLSAQLLDAGPGMERTDIGEMVALDIDATRLQRVTANLARLGLRAQGLAGDGSRPDEWWDGVLFDRILLDAPCSATGVIRRHPDIKWLRQPGDIAGLTAMQGKLLDALWPLLAPGGMLLYATCSVLKAENSLQVEAFAERTPDAGIVEWKADRGRHGKTGWQILPGENGMDGFFYAGLLKN